MARHALFANLDFVPGVLKYNAESIKLSQKNDTIELLLGLLFRLRME